MFYAYTSFNLLPYVSYFLHLLFVPSKVFRLELPDSLQDQFNSPLQCVISFVQHIIAFYSDHYNHSGSLFRI